MKRVEGLSRDKRRERGEVRCPITDSSDNSDSGVARMERSIIDRVARSLLLVKEDYSSSRNLSVNKQVNVKCPAEITL